MAGGWLRTEKSYLLACWVVTGPAGLPSFIESPSRACVYQMLRWSSHLGGKKELLNCNCMGLRMSSYYTRQQPMATSTNAQCAPCSRRDARRQAAPGGRQWRGTRQPDSAARNKTPHKPQRCLKGKGSTTLRPTCSPWGKHLCGVGALVYTTRSIRQQARRPKPQGDRSRHPEA